MSKIALWVLSGLLLISVPAAIQASDLLVLDKPVVISSQEVRQDLNRALLAVVMKVRGRTAEDIAELQVRLSEQAVKSLPDKTRILAPFTLKEARISTLLAGTKPGGGRVAGIFVFEDDFMRQFELAFALHYQIEESDENILIHGAGVGENSPLPPVTSLLVVESKDVPANFGSDFHTWQDIFAFAVMKRINLATAAETHVGARDYHVFQFVHSHMPDGDWIGSVTSDSSEGQKGETGKQLINTYDGWKIFTTRVRMDLASPKPLYFKMLYKPRHAGTKEFDGKTVTAATFTPHLGGQFIAQKLGKVDLNSLSSPQVKAGTAARSRNLPGSTGKTPAGSEEIVNLALRRPTLVSSISRYSERQDVTKDGDGAVDGDRGRGLYGFHTDKEAAPWWQVDLGDGAIIDEIKVYNRASDAARARTLRVLISDDGQSWRQVHENGGKSFSLLKVPLNQNSARYLRLQLAEATWFHLDEVEVWGTRDRSVSKGTTPVKAVNASGESHWSSPEWKAKLDFWQSGERMVSYYRTNNDRGWLWAEVKGNSYEGWWSETASNEKCSTKKNDTYYWGRIIFSIKGEKLTGRWSYCDKAPATAWTATKIESAPAFGVSPKWSLFGSIATKPKEPDVGQKARMIPGKMSPLSDDGRVRLEVIDPKEGFRLINEITGYSFLPPFDNWRIAKPEPTGRIIIRDQGSCSMSFVPGHLVPGNPGTSLPPRQFEKHWWQQMGGADGSISRSSFGPVTIASYPAYFGIYDTNEGVLKSYFIKLPHTYLVAGFKCGTKQFNSQLAKFEKALSTLKALTEAKARKPTVAVSKPQPVSTARPADTVTADVYAKLFQQPGFGFTMPYPKNWTYEKPSSWTVVFSGPKGTDSYYTTVTIQNLSSQSYPDMDVVIADLKAQLKASGKKHRWYSTLPYLHMDDAGNVQGKQFTMEYWEGKEKLRRTGIIIPRPKEGIYHYWSYTAPETLYGESHDLAEAMRDGFQRTTGGNAASTSR